MDGTLRVCPSFHVQLFTLYGMVGDSVVPLVYALLPCKKRATYYDLFATVRARMGDMDLVLDPDQIT